MSFLSGNEYEICLNQTIQAVIEVVPDNFTLSDVSISWYLNESLVTDENSLSLSVSEAGEYDAEVIFNDTGCSAIITATVAALPCEFPQGISPGVSPGFNDTFNLNGFDVTELKVFNRYGSLVYSKNNYTNEWEGQTNDGEELPVGTYFYTVRYEGGAKNKAGWVYVNR